MGVTNDEAKTRVAETAALAIGGFEVGFAKNPARCREPEIRREPIGLDQGISFLRPLARRRARILRPFAVAMRARKPWVRARRTLLG